jgi:hypothetical protein
LTIIWGYIVDNTDILSIIFGSVSAVAWMLAGFFSVNTSGYYGGPPKKIRCLANFGRFSNFVAAFNASLMMATLVIERLYQIN